MRAVRQERAKATGKLQAKLKRHKQVAKWHREQQGELHDLLDSGWAMMQEFSASTPRTMLGLMLGQWGPKVAAIVRRKLARNPLLPIAECQMYPCDLGVHAKHVQFYPIVVRTPNNIVYSSSYVDV